MGRRKDTKATLVLSRSQLYSIKRAQFEIRMQGFTYVDEGKLAKNLSAYASILSLAFMLPTPVTLAAGVIAGISSIPSERDTIISMCRRGEDYLQSLIYLMDDNPQYDFVKVELPFLQFVDEEFRIISGYGRLIAVHVGSGWVIVD